MIRILAQLLKPKKRQNKAASSQLVTEEEHGFLSDDLEKNKKKLQEFFEYCDDLVIRHLSLGGGTGADAMAVFLEPLVDPQLLHHCVIQPLISAKKPVRWSIEQLKDAVISSGGVAEKRSWREVTQGIASGLVGLFVDGERRALLVSVPAENSRSIEKPTAETVIRGPSDAFNDDIRKSIALLRKRLRTPRLAVENLQLGEISKTPVKLVYLKGYVMEGLPEEIKRRLQRIRVDGILGSGQVEEYIQDNPYSPFNHLEITERPDKLAAALLEGRAALFFDGTPFPLIIPTTLNAQLQSPEDYFNRYWFASFIRVLRWLAALGSLLLPSLYVAIITFHQELLPTPLLMTILASREGIPFPALVEALIMVVIFEVLHEAGVRLPKAFGQAVSIVGAIVLGQASVSAGLVSAPMVIIISLTAVSSFVIPSIPLASTVRILRIPFMLAAGSFGLVGIMALLLVMTFHLCALRSFGVPYLSPMAPLSFSDLKDFLIRAPVWMMLRRPKDTGAQRPYRQAPGLKPHPPAMPGETPIGKRRKK